MNLEPATPAILHVDMDAFYAAIEERDNPELRGKPVMVGGTPEGRGVVAAANYVARRYGVYSATPAAQARRLCPDGVFLPIRMDRYVQVSRQIRAIFERYTPLVEPLSLDEAFLDVGDSQRLFGSGADIGARIQAEIADELGLVASVGVAPNKFLAKIASDLEKPKGFVVVPADGVGAFLAPLPISRLWGVGKVTARGFDKLGIRRIGQLRPLPQSFLHQHFGAAGDHLWRLAQGLDERPVCPDHAAKSISHETTFATDLYDAAQLRAWLAHLVEQVAARLRLRGLEGRTVQIKVRFADFETLTRAHTLPHPSAATGELIRASQALFDTHFRNCARGIRLLGMGVSGLQGEGAPGVQADLFAQAERQQQRRLDQVADQISGRFGRSAVRRGGGLGRD